MRFATGPGLETPGNEVVCDLCESWEQPDALTIRATLRADARWHPVAPVGRRLVTSDDVIFSFERMGQPGSPHAALFSNVASVSAPDDRTVEIKLRAPDAEALEKLADGRAKIVPRLAVEQLGDLLRGPTAGSGPWVVAAFSVEAVTYEANREYYQAGIPYLDRLEVQVVPDASTRVVAVRNHILDFAQEEEADVHLALAEIAGLRAFSIIEPGTGVEVALNTGRAPFDTLEFRRTLLTAWGPRPLMGEAWGLLTLTTAGFPGTPPSWLLPPDEATQALAGPDATPAGLATNAEIRITVGDFEDRFVRTAEYMAAAWQSLGAHVEIEKVPTRVFGDRIWTRGEFDVMVGSPPPFAGLTGYLLAVHHSKGAFNKTGYSTAEIDRLIEAQSVELDSVKRRGLVLELQRQSLAGAHRYMPVTRHMVWVHSDQVMGLRPNLYRGESHWLTQVWMGPG